MLMSTLVRLASGVGLFILLARILGVEDFGALMFSFTVGTLLALVVEYGFTTSMLREIGAAPQNAERILSRAFAAKIFLSAVLVVFLAMLWVLPGNLTDYDDLIFLMSVAAIATSFGEFFNVVFRALGRFHRETIIVIHSSLVHVAVLLVLALVDGRVHVVAGGFVATRTFYAVQSWWRCREVAGHLIYPRVNGVIDLFGVLRSGRAYALDVWLVNVTKHVDTILVQVLLGTAAVGLYQAGMNLARGLERLGPVLANVYLPTLANRQDDHASFEGHARRLQLQLLLAGTLVFVAMIAGRDVIPGLIFGPEFAQLAELLPYFGSFVLVRYFAVSQGVLLTAAGLQSKRVVGLVLSLGVLLAISPVLVAQMGLAGMALAQILAVILLASLYGFTLRHHGITNGFSQAGLLICLLAIGAGGGVWFYSL